MTEQELQKKHPMAFEALPEPYQNDSCLIFWIEQDPVMGETIMATPKETERFIVGDWTAGFLNGQWVEVPCQH